MPRSADATQESGSCGSPPTYRNKPRRRGDQLHDAIYQATLDELAQVGYAELTMDRVATRAKASKGSLYRRWPSRVELVIDAIQYGMPRFAEPADTGELRGDLIAALRQIADELEGPSGQAARGLIAEVVRNPELIHVISSQLVDPLEPVMMEVLRRGVVRGEVRPTALAPRITSVGTDLLMMHFLIRGTPITDETLTEITDKVLIPLVTLNISAGDGHHLTR